MMNCVAPKLPDIRSIYALFRYQTCHNPELHNYRQLYLRTSLTSCLAQQFMPKWAYSALDRVSNPGSMVHSAEGVPLPTCFPVQRSIMDEKSKLAQFEIYIKSIIDLANLFCRPNNIKYQLQKYFNYILNFRMNFISMNARFNVIT